MEDHYRSARRTNDSHPPRHHGGKLLTAVLLIIMLAAPASAWEPCTMSSDPDSAPCTESDARRAPNGTWVVASVVNGAATGTGYVNGRPVSTASVSRSGGLTIDGRFTLRRDPYSRRTTFRDASNGATYVLDGSQASAQRLNAYLGGRVGAPVRQVWTDIIWAFRAGWASAECNRATLNAEAAALALVLCAAAATTAALYACLAAVIANYYEALEAQAIACQT